MNDVLNMFKVNNKDNGTTSVDIVLMSIVNYEHIQFNIQHISIFVARFEHAIGCWKHVTILLTSNFSASAKGFCMTNFFPN